MVQATDQIQHIAPHRGYWITRTRAQEEYSVSVLLYLPLSLPANRSLTISQHLHKLAPTDLDQIFPVSVEPNPHDQSPWAMTKYNEFDVIALAVHLRPSRTRGGGWRAG